MEYTTYQATVVGALQSLYTKVITFLPDLVVAVIVLILGWLVAIFLSKLVLKVLEAIRIDSLADQLGLRELSDRTGRKLSLAHLGAWIIKWFFFLVSFIAATEILGLTEVTQFLYQDVLGYVGHVIVAIAILILGILAANFFSGIVESTIRAGGMRSASAMGAFTRWAILVFAIIMALSELLPRASEFLQDLFKAIVAMIAIAGGIAFGLGGKEHAKKILDSIESDLTKRE